MIQSILPGVVQSQPNCSWVKYYFIASASAEECWHTLSDAHRHCDMDLTKAFPTTSDLLRPVFSTESSAFASHTSILKTCCGGHCFSYDRNIWTTIRKIELQVFLYRYWWCITIQLDVRFFRLIFAHLIINLSGIFVFFQTQNVNWFCVDIYLLVHAAWISWLLQTGQLHSALWWTSYANSHS